MAKKLCDFCLSESKGFFNKPEKIAGNHYICKNCKSIIQSYDMPLKYGIFQKLVTADKHMRSMMMDAYLEDHSASEAMAQYFPQPDVELHEDEHCVNVIPAVLTVTEALIPEAPAVRTVAEVRKSTIQNIPDASSKDGAVKVKGMLYETEAGLYFMSEHFVNCHRIGYIQKNSEETRMIRVQTPTKTFTYKVDHADLFYMREKFFTKVNAAINNKHSHLIYISNDNRYRVTPGVYSIPDSLNPGNYSVKPLKGKGLHIKDEIGRIINVPEDATNITLPDGGVLECTGEFELKWIEQVSSEK